MYPRAMSLDGQPEIPKQVGVMILLDRSSSMSTIQKAMTTAFDTFIQDQRDLGADGMWVTLHQFDSKGYDVVYDRTAVAQVGGLKLTPRGMTPLIDALWTFGTAAKQIVDDPHDITDRLLLVVITDGQENASSQRTWAEVKALLDTIEGDEREIIWLGEKGVLQQAQDFLGTQVGATVPLTNTNKGVHYATVGMRSAAMRSRVGASAARTTTHYTTNVGADSNAGAFDAYVNFVKADVDATMKAAKRKKTDHDTNSIDFVNKSK